VGAAGFDVDSGYGRLNVAGALGGSALEAHIASPTNRTTVSTRSFTLKGSARGTGVLSYRVEYGVGRSPSGWLPAAGPFFTEVADDGALAEVDALGWPDGLYSVRLRVEHVSGAVFEDRLTITVNRILISEPADNTILRGGGLLEFRGTIAPADL